MSNFNTRIKLKRDTAVNWTVNNPVLLNGEIILVDTDSGELRAKVGDGTKTYTQLPFTDEILKNLITNKQNKLTGSQGQIVGFGEDGSAQPEDFPGLTQAQGDERYLPKTGGNVTGLLRLARTETGGSLYFGESIDGSDGMINSSNGTMGISVGTPAENRVMMALYESTGELALQVKKGSDAGNFRFSPNGLDMKMKPILNCPTLDGKQNKLTGTQGQVVGFDESGNAVAQAAPDTGVTSFKGRKGAVTPQNGDYTADMVGARSNTWIPSASDVGAVPTSRTVNGKALTENISLAANDVGAVPTSRTVNGKSLNSNISLSASDVDAAPQYTYGTTDLTAGSSTLATGTLYFVYE